MGVNTKILLVEADQAWAELIGQLAKKDYKLKHVPSADAALEALDKEDFDAMIVNLSLPGHNGIELLNERLSHQDLLEVPVLVYGPWPELEQIDTAAWRAYSVDAWLRQTKLVKELPGKLAEIL
jgi:DNA-binding NtrC family response regulator